MTAPALDLEAGRGIDLRRVRDAAATRWWIVAVGVVAGIVLGALYSVSGGSLYEASALIAPGQVFNQGGGRILTYASSPRGINEIATSASAAKRAAARAHMPVSELRGNVRTESVSTGAGPQAATGTQLVRITVRGHKPRKVEDAANALAEVVKADTTARFVEGQISKLNNRVEIFNNQLAVLQKVIDQFNATLKSSSLSDLDKLVLVNQLDAAIARQGNLNDKVFATEQQLTLLNTIEIAQIITPAAAEKTVA